MAVDTQAKRFAMLGFASRLVSLVVVDAAVTTADRVSWLALYNGITLDEGGSPYLPYSPLKNQRDIIPFVMAGG